MRLPRPNIVGGALVSLLLAACQAQRPSDALPKEEIEARRNFASATVALSGQVVDTAGAGVAGATVRVRGRQTNTGADGAFAFEALARENALVEVAAPNKRAEVVPVELRRPVAERAVQLSPVVLEPKETPRLLFTGDFAIARRFLDPEDRTPRDALPATSLGALVQPDNPAQGSVKATSFVQAVFDAADYRVVNLESVVTDSPKTPHNSKPFAFFTLPGSLAALKALGVQYAGLGNNHIYDYLETGVRDTIRHLDAAGIHHSGAGDNEREAFAPRRVQIGASSYAFVSACSVAGEEYHTGFLATGDKGGAADLRDTARVGGVISAERAAGHLPIALFHGGYEYSERPSPNVVRYLHHAATQGAVLGIGHHPHTPQGFGRHQGVLLAFSLGNFVFDQDRVETMVGLLAEIGLRGDRLESARALPVYLEDYRPRLIAGALSDQVLRRIAQLSFEHGVEVVAHNGRGIILPEGVSARIEERAISAEVEVGANGFGVVDLRGLLRPAESISSVSLGGAARSVSAGLDLLRHGDFDDHDVDGDQGETARWDLDDPASFPCLHQARSGVAALCQVKSPQRSISDAHLRTRVRVPQDGEEPPNFRMTVLGWQKGQQAGRSQLYVKYFASEGERAFGEQLAIEVPAGSYDWTQVAADLVFPADPPKPTEATSPRAVRLMLRHHTPPRANGLLAVDDLAIVSWETAPGPQLALATPNAYDFLRVEGAPGRHRVELTVRAHRLPLP